MTDKYKNLRDALANLNEYPWSDETRNKIIRAAPGLLADLDELESALTLSGKVNKRLMDELAVVVAERDALREALSACRNYISDNRESRAAAELAQMVDAALAQHEGEKHGDQ